MTVHSTLGDARRRYRRMPLVVHPVGVKRHLDTKRRIAAGETFQLHLGCGQRHLTGFVNIDRNYFPATDLVCDIAKLPFAPETVSRIETYHVIEHMEYRAVPVMLKHWRSLMVPRAALVIECPDFDAAVREYLSGNNDRIFNIFGLGRFPSDQHRFGYNGARLRGLLHDAGFYTISRELPMDYHKDKEPCMRIEAVA